MFKCSVCGRVFEKPDIIPGDRSEFWGTPVREPLAVCPYCKHSDFDEAEEDDDGLE